MLSKKQLKTQQLDGETLYLTYIINKWWLTIEPENNRNGTQRYDGWYPRCYSKVSHAKMAVTKKLGKEWQWHTH